MQTGNHIRKKEILGEYEIKFPLSDGIFSIYYYIPQVVQVYPGTNKFCLNVCIIV